MGTIFLFVVMLALQIILYFVKPSNPNTPFLFSSVTGFMPMIIACIVIYVLGGINFFKEWERGVVLLFGRFNRVIGPGFVWLDPVFHRIFEIKSIRDEVWNIAVKSVQTKDNVPIGLTIALTERLNPNSVRDFVINVCDGEEAVTRRAIATVTELVATWTLEDLLHKRIELNRALKELLHGKVSEWGVEIKGVEVTEFQIQHEQIAKALAMKAAAQREGEAEVVRAELQFRVASALAEAAKLYDNPMAMRLRGLEMLAELARSGNNNTILIPTDLVDLFSSLGNHSKK